MAKSYVIQRGDTLSAIAKRNGISLQQLLDWNPVFRDNPKYKGGNMIWSGGTVYLEADNPRTSGNRPQPPPPPPVVWPPAPPPPDPKPPEPEPPKPVPTLEDLENQLKGPDRDAYSALKTLFTSYGLESLAPRILEYVQNGFGSDTIAILLQQTPEYKKRFAANESRKSKGLPVISPAEYLQIENSYRQILRQGGLPEGFYDSYEDFTNFITADVSPTEFKSRVDLATMATAGADPALRQALNNLGISNGDLNAYWLDPQRALPILQKNAATAQVGAAALRQGLEMNAQRAEQWATLGITADQAQQGFGAIAGYLPQAQALGKIYGEQYDQGTAEAEVFGQSGAAQNQRKRLASQERAQFGGATGSARGGLGVQRGK